jgi:hypothetical protein
MEKSTESLSANDFFQKLQEGTLGTAVPVRLTGMVKKHEGKEKAIQFALGANCSGWITIPLEFIEDVEVLRIVRCKDHSHPLVKLNLKTAKTPEGKTFLSLLEGMQAAGGQPAYVGTPMAYAGGGRRGYPGQPIAYAGMAQPMFGGMQPAPALMGGGFGGGGPSAIESGCDLRCYPAVCPNPSGHGTIWCTVCQTECIDVPEFGGGLFSERNNLKANALSATCQGGKRALDSFMSRRPMRQSAAGRTLSF